MTKTNLKNYKHESDGMSEACGIDEETHKNLLKFCFHAIAKTDCISKAVEIIEKTYSQQIEPKLFLRFLIAQTCLFIFHNQKQEKVLDILSEIMPPGAKDMAVDISNFESFKELITDTLKSLKEECEENNEETNADSMPNGTIKH